MSALDFVGPSHHNKSKTTLLLTKELAVACPCAVVDTAKSIAEAKLADPARLRKCSQATLAPLLLYRSEHSEYTVLRDTAVDHDDVSSTLSAGLSVLSLVEQFNCSLSRFANSNIYLVNSPHQLLRLLDLYYSDDNALAPLADMFPYLHGLNSMKQRVYFHDRFDAASDLSLLSCDVASLPARFPHSTDVKVPDAGFHLMTVNSLDAQNPRLVNSISVDDLLTFKTSCSFSPNSTEFDYTSFEMFDHVYQLQDSLGHPLELMNRNYHMQIKLMAPLSHFIVYNNSMNFGASTEAAKAISYLMGPLSNRFVYVVDFEASKWPQMGSYLDSHTAYTICDKTYDAEPGPLHDRLLALEQNLTWQLNGLKQLFPRLYVGNIYNFKQLHVLPRRASHYDFKLHIYCHENAKLPSLATLSELLATIELSGLLEPLYLEFPDSIFRTTSTLSQKETLSYLNTLKAINLVVNEFKKNVFVYSFDGFTGITLLSLSLGLFWGGDSLEDVACSVFRKTFKFYFMKGDYAFLKNFEVYIQWFKRQTLKDFLLVHELPLSTISTNYRHFKKSCDWFDGASDVNFPSHIYDNLFLGSVDHASSVTVLHALRINKVISIDEKPAWFKHLKCTFEHEATPSTPGPILKPIYSFNKGNSLLYEVSIHTPALEAKLFQQGTNYPHVKSIIYIYNIRDDGKDSLLPLLVDCPEHIQKKILVEPKEKTRALVHCRIGVSRSASVVIASVMKHYSMDLLESYMYVRVRRFNVIVQPNLRIFYELFLYEEQLRKLRCGDGSKKKHCWWVVCEQIHRLNQQYIR